MLRRKGQNFDGPKIWLIGGSFFWNQLNVIKRIFTWSTSWSIGHGYSISFWFDSWSGASPQDHRLVIPNQLISLREAWEIRDTLDPNTIYPEDIIFTDERDTIVWRWEISGIYTAKSAYRLLSGGGRIKWRYANIWKCKMPHSVQLFTYFLLKGKLLTREGLRRRGMHIEVQCPLCQNCPVESALHVLFLCPYAIEVWFNIGRLLDRPIFQIAGTVRDVWEASWSAVQSQGGMSKREWTGRFACAAWFIWKQRNKAVFTSEWAEAKVVAVQVIQEMELWKRNC